jgi:hypothetical protein
LNRSSGKQRTPSTRLVAAKCPSCDAVVRVEPRRKVATCAYCQTSYFVAAPAQPDQKPPPAAAPREAVAPHVWATALGAIVVLVGIAVLLLWLSRHKG